jgi:Lon protease-like protein
MGFPGTGDDVNNRLGADGAGLPKSVCILPFHYTDVLLQGETKQLRLYEERFIELFQDAMDHHCGVVAMGLIADSGIIQTVPICEIEAYNRMDDFGIFVTIRVVARAQLLEITKQTPYIKAACLEINDKVPPNLEFPNLVASNIENFMLVLSSMEHRLAQAKQERGADSATDEEEDEKDSEMQRRINIAKLVRTVLYDSGNDVTIVARCCLTWTHSCHVSFATVRRRIDSTMILTTMRMTKRMMMTTTRMIQMVLMAYSIGESDFDSRTKLPWRRIHRVIRVVQRGRRVVIGRHKN